MTWSPPLGMEPKDVAAHDALIAAYRGIIAELRGRWEAAQTDSELEAVRWRTHVAAGDAEAMLRNLRTLSRWEARTLAREGGSPKEASDE